MKYYIFSAFLILAVCSCQDQEIHPDTTTSNPLDHQFQRVDQSLNISRAVGISNANFQPVLLRGSVEKANGHFLSAGLHQVSFSAVENAGGTHGQAEMSGPVYNMHLETYCISVSGNRATIAGIVTQIEDLPENYPTPFDVGYQFYYAVEDNGEGSGSGPERSHGYVYIGPPGAPPFCEILLPDHPVYWPEEFWFDTLGENDQIDVK